MLIPLCLSFISLQANDNLSLVPQHIQNLSEQRIIRQLSEYLPDYKISFNNKDCPTQASYYYESQALVLSGDNEIWKGHFQASITDILDGKKLAIENNIVHQSIVPVLEMKREPKKIKKKWMAWIAGTVALSAALTYYYHQNKSKNNLRRNDTPPVIPPVEDGGEEEALIHR